jgi:broad specificity phosphatase PhoE
MQQDFECKREQEKIVQFLVHNYIIYPHSFTRMPRPPYRHCYGFRRCKYTAKFVTSLVLSNRINPGIEDNLMHHYLAGIVALLVSSFPMENNESANSDFPNLKRILLIRHGRSLANDMMERPGNRWGDPEFQDDPTLIDSSLSQLGTEQALQLSKVLSTDQEIQRLQLVVLSPLTRAIQTHRLGLSPVLPTNVPVLVEPLATERVYTASDIGRSVRELKQEFGKDNIDFGILDANVDEWWYQNPSELSQEDIKEWRPHNANQFYCVPGEPWHIFEERMKKLEIWLSQRPETCLALVTHWGVLRYLTGGDEFKNCESRWMTWPINKV